MTTLAKLPGLLDRISTLESGAALCRRRYCYAEAFSWLPYGELHQEPVDGRHWCSDLPAHASLHPCLCGAWFSSNRLALHRE